MVISFHRYLILIIRSYLSLNIPFQNSTKVETGHYWAVLYLTEKFYFSDPIYLNVTGKYLAVLQFYIFVIYLILFPPNYFVTTYSSVS